MPPQVRDLQTLIAEQQAALTPQKQLIDADIVANANAGAAQEQGLNATKDAQFKKIEQAGQNKGMFFSGFSPDEQAQYTAGTYLPALAQLQATIASTRSNLLGKKADLDLDAFKSATNMRETDRSNFNTYQQQELQRAFESDQANKDRAFKSSESAKDRAAAMSAASAKSADRPTIQQSILSAFAGAGYTKGAKGRFTEDVLVPQLAADYGVGRDDALRMAYTLRKQFYGD